MSKSSETGQLPQLTARMGPCDGVWGRSFCLYGTLVFLLLAVPGCFTKAVPASQGSSPAGSGESLQSDEKAGGFKPTAPADLPFLHPRSKLEGQGNLHLAAEAREAAAGVDKATKGEGHHDSEAYIRMLERPGRDEYQKPEQVVSALHLSPGQVVADIGAGSGYFTVKLARAVGPTGKVYAEDIWPAMLDHLEQRVSKEGVTNVELILGEPENPKLPTRAIDVAFISNTWHHIEKPSRFLANLLPALKEKVGEVVVIDYLARETPVGPPLQKRVPRAEVEKVLERAGLELISEVELLPYQYFLIFKSGGASR